MTDSNLHKFTSSHSNLNYFSGPSTFPFVKKIFVLFLMVYEAAIIINLYSHFEGPIKI